MEYQTPLLELDNMVSVITYGGNNGFSVPPDPQLTTFGIVMNNSYCRLHYNLSS